MNNVFDARFYAILNVQTQILSALGTLVLHEDYESMGLLRPLMDRLDAQVDEYMARFNAENNSA